MRSLFKLTALLTCWHFPPPPDVVVDSEGSAAASVVVGSATISGLSAGTELVDASFVALAAAVAAAAAGSGTAAATGTGLGGKASARSAFGSSTLPDLRDEVKISVKIASSTIVN